MTVDTTVLAIALVEDCLVVMLAGPYTAIGPGLGCLVCGDPIDAGSPYAFVTWSAHPGLAHECCLEPAPSWVW